VPRRPRISCINSMLLSILSTLVYLVGALPLTLIALIAYKKIKRLFSPPLGLQQENWVQDVVYLCQFPSVPHVKSISPFALKLETWLRLTGIKYENVYTLQFSSKGQIPYIELNGEAIADSNIIMDRLKVHFKVDPDRDLDDQQVAVSHTTLITIEHHLAFIGFHYRYGYNMPQFLHKLNIINVWPGNAAKWWGRFQPYATRFRDHISGLGRHENQELYEMSFQDLKSMSLFLGDKDFYLGSTPTSVDCAIFGHLAQFIYIDIGFPQTKYMEENCRNLLDLVERVRERLWEDWEQLCQEPTNKKNK